MLGKSAAKRVIERNLMSRLTVLIIVVVLVLGGLIFLSTVPKEKPTQQIEVAVPQGGNAR